MVGLVLLLLLPAHIAAFVAWRGGASFPRKALFTLVCVLLSYGVASLVGVLFVPFQFVAVQLAPQWGVDGFTLPSKVLAPVASSANLVSSTCGVIAAFIIPVRLRALWPNLVNSAR